MLSMLREPALLALSRAVWELDGRVSLVLNFG